MAMCTLTSRPQIRLRVSSERKNGRGGYELTEEDELELKLLRHSGGRERMWRSEEMGLASVIRIERSACGGPGASRRPSQLVLGRSRWSPSEAPNPSRGSHGAGLQVAEN